MDTKTLALHLIKEDLKYHQMVAQCSGVEIHIEFFPDLATVVKALLGQEPKGSEWEDAYVLGMGAVAEVQWGDQTGVEREAIALLDSLVDLK